MAKLNDDEINEFVKLKDDGYFRLRLIQVLEQLAIAHGCYADTEQLVDGKWIPVDKPCDCGCNESKE